MGLQYKGSWSKGRDGDCRVVFSGLQGCYRVEGGRFEVWGFGVQGLGCFIFRQLIEGPKDRNTRIEQTRSGPKHRNHLTWVGPGEGAGAGEGAGGGGISAKLH